MESGVNAFQRRQCGSADCGTEWFSGVFGVVTNRKRWHLALKRLLSILNTVMRELHYFYLRNYCTEACKPTTIVCNKSK